MKTALIHDWIIDIGGAEKCLECIYELYPSDIFTLLYEAQSAISIGIDQRKIHSSFLQKFPQAKKRYRNYLPLFPFAIEQFDLAAYEVVISSSHAVAKGVLTNSNQLHICYCYTPIRYGWDLYHQYLKETGLDKGFRAKIAKAILHYIRIWDLSTVNRVDHFIAISAYIAKRIKHVYGRNASVIYPPVEVNKFELLMNKENFYVTASRMVPYKKMDMIVEAFSSMPEKKLIVIGDGPDKHKAVSRAGSNVQFLGYQRFDVLKHYMQRAKAFVFAAEEDFGIIPVEAQACGTPVIAFGRGGVTETVVPLLNDAGKELRALGKPTGVFFFEQTAAALVEAVQVFEKHQDKFDCCEIRKNAERFSVDRFRKEFKEFVDSKISSSKH